MNISRALADFIVRTDYDDIPAHVIENQKKSVLDAIGITYGASTLGDGVPEMLDIAETLAAGGRGEATVMACGKKLPAIWAAFANAAMAHGLDYGDTHDRSTMHSNSSSFPAALAVAEQTGGVDGKRLLTALVLGSEVCIRMAMAAGVNDVSFGFYPPTIFSSYGATAAVAKLMGLTAEQIVSAFSFNLCQSTCSSELMNNKQTVVRSIREAFTARNAILSCCMAKKDLRGFAQPLEGKYGFYHAFLRDNWHPEAVLDGLGERWEAAELTYKVWPCCFGNHSPITATLQLVREHGLTAADIHSIEVEIGPPNNILCEPIEEKRNPENAINGKFSIPFNIASVIVRGNVTIDSYSDALLHDPEIRALTAKIGYIYHADWPRGTETRAIVRMDTAKGRFEKTVDSPFGTPANPMDDAAFEAKFDSCAAKAFCPKTPAELDAIKGTVRRLETLPDIRELTALL